MDGGSDRNRVRAVAPSSKASNKDSDSDSDDSDLSYFSNTVTANINLPDAVSNSNSDASASATRIAKLAKQLVPLGYLDTLLVRGDRVEDGQKAFDTMRWELVRHDEVGARSLGGP